jgi:hypothetical protein
MVSTDKAPPRRDIVGGEVGRASSMRLGGASRHGRGGGQREGDFSASRRTGWL